MKLEEFEKSYPQECLEALEDVGNGYNYVLECPHCERCHEEPQDLFEYSDNDDYYSECKNCGEIFEWAFEWITEASFCSSKIDEEGI